VVFGKPSYQSSNNGDSTSCPRQTRIGKRGNNGLV
jgi:hypothetical protein